MGLWRTSKRMMVAALLAGAALRAAFVLLAPHIAGDSFVYGDLAANLLHKHVYGLTEGPRIRPTLIRLPGYPLFLAACFAVFGTAKYTAVLWVQVVVDLLTCWLVGETARVIAGKRAGFAALWLAALCPFTANYVAAPLTETLVLLTVAAAFYALVRWLGSQRKEVLCWVWFLGVALAFSILLRPDQGLLAVAIVAAMVWFALRSFTLRSAERSKRLLNVAMVCAIVAAPLALWGARNWRVFHVVQPLAPRYATDPGERVNYGFQRWYRTWGVEFASTDAVYWTYDGSPILMDVLPARACDDAAQCAGTAAALDRYNQTSAASAQSDADFAKLADQRVQRAPLRYYIATPVARLADMWLRPRTEMLPVAIRWWKWSDHPWQTLLAGAYATLNLALLVLSVAGLRRWRQRGCGAFAAAMMLFVLLRCALLLTIDNSEPRYTLECFPVLLVWAGMWFARREVSG